MGKKGTKRKTRWRTLSINEYSDENSVTDTVAVNFTSATTTDGNMKGETSVDENFRYVSRRTNSSSSYFKRQSSPFRSSSQTNYKTYNNISNDYRNSYYNSTKHTTRPLSSSSSVYSSSRYSFKRRPFSLQNGNGVGSSAAFSKYYSSYGAGRATSRAQRTNSEPTDSGVGSDSSKPLFNEDDYTRITTPRQDVIFKKGYFAQPKKYLSSTDTNTTSSAAASIVSAEETMSASVPSLSPEQCSSQADSLDPEHAFMYSYFDQNGVFYVNPYFDPYGQMLMMPYGYPPYAAAASDATSPGSSELENPTSVDSNENMKDLSNNSTTETHEESEHIIKSSENCDSTSEKDSKNERADGNTPEETGTDSAVTVKDEEKQEDNVQTASEASFAVGVQAAEETTDASPAFLCNVGYPQQFYPQFYYPYAFGPPFMPMNGLYYDPSKELNDVGLERHNKYRRRRRKRPQNDGNSTSVSAATTDYSEAEISDDEKDDMENNPSSSSVKSCQVAVEQFVDTVEPNNENTAEEAIEIKQSTLNTEVEEFVPKQKTPLNAEVDEFKPRNYLNSVSSTPSVDPKLDPQLDTKTAKPQSPKTRNSAIIKAQNTQQTARPELFATTQSACPQNVCKQISSPLKQEKSGLSKKSEPTTFADKIKIGLIKDFHSSGESPSIAKKSVSNRGLQSTIKKHSKLPRNSPFKISAIDKTVVSNGLPTYAQMLNQFETSKNDVNDHKEPQNFAADSKLIEKSLTLLSTDTQDETPCSVAIAPKTAEPPTQVWLTVKPRGRRSKKEIIVDGEEWPEEEESQKLEELKRGSVKNKIIPLIKEAKKKEEITNDKAKISVPLSPADPEIIAPASSSSQKKKPQKSRNNKKTNQPKKLSPPKKSIKGFDVVEPQFVSCKKKTDLDTSDASNKTDSEDSTLKSSNEDIEDEELCSSLLQTPTNSEPDLTFDGFNTLQRSHSGLNKSFGPRRMDILNGFDYKFKDNSINKEEEEMVLNVIKSLSSVNTGFGKSNGIPKFNNFLCNTNLTNCLGIVKNLNGGSLADLKDLEEKGSKSDGKSDYDEVSQTGEENDEDTVVSKNDIYTNKETDKETSDLDSLSELSSDDPDDLSKQLVKTSVNPKREKSVTMDILNEKNDAGTNLKPSHCDSAPQALEQKIENANEKDIVHQNIASSEREPESLCTEKEFTAAISESESVTELSSSNLIEQNTDIYSGQENINLEFTAPENETKERDYFTSNGDLGSGENRRGDHVEYADRIAPESENSIAAKYEPNCFKISSKEETSCDLNTLCCVNSDNESQNGCASARILSNGGNNSTDGSNSRNAAETETKVEKISNDCEKSSVPNGHTNLQAILKDTESLLSSLVTTFETLSSSDSEDSPRRMKIREKKSAINQGTNRKSGSSETFNSVSLTNLQMCENGLSNHNVTLEENHHMNGLCKQNSSISASEDSHETANTNKKIIKTHQNTINASNTSANAVPLDHEFHKQLSHSYPQSTKSVNAHSTTSPITSSSSVTSNMKNCDKLPYSNDHEILPNDAIPTQENIEEIKTPSPRTFPNVTSRSSSESSKTTPNGFKLSLTAAVMQWLSDESKEKTPEPIFRLPPDSVLSTVIESSRRKKIKRPPDDNATCAMLSDNDDDLSSSSASDNDEQDDGEDMETYEKTATGTVRKPHPKHPKNLKSNPSHVSSVKRISHKESPISTCPNSSNSSNCGTDNEDSDYLSDSHKHERNDDNACERVANQNSDTVKYHLKNSKKFKNEIMKKVNDNESSELLDFWDDEFVNNPQKWISPISSRCSTTGGHAEQAANGWKQKRLLSITPSDSSSEFQTQLAQYESVYGKSINYNKLISNNEFLSDNIINFNTDCNMKKIMINKKNDKVASLNNLKNNLNNVYDNFDNRIHNDKTNENCLKPPEVCCILM